MLKRRAQQESIAVSWDALHGEFQAGPDRRLIWATAPPFVGRLRKPVCSKARSSEGGKRRMWQSWEAPADDSIFRSLTNWLFRFTLNLTLW